MHAHPSATADAVPVLHNPKLLLSRLTGGKRLTAGEAESLVELLLADSTTHAQAGAILTVLSVRTETSAELIGFASAMRRRMTALPTGIPGLVDTAGTGGSRARGFNVSTAAAIIAAPAGVPVAKHGGRAGTSASGSADVLQALGVNVGCAPATALACLHGAGIAFLFAPNYHAAMARVAPIRRELGIRTTFNLAGPLANPCGARRQVIGVAEPPLLEVVAQAVVALGADHVLVVHGRDGLDEISIAAATDVIEVRGGSLRRFTVTPAVFGVEPRPYAPERAAPEHNARLLRDLLAGQADAALFGLVLCNAAAAAYVSGRFADLRAAAAACREAIASGAATRTLDRLVAISSEHQVRA